MTKKKVEMSASHLTCRFYANELPFVDDVVVGKVYDISETGAYVNLVEYDNHDGTIPLSELSRVRVRSVKNHVRVGRSEYIAVIRLDEGQGYVDLSKSKVYRKDLLACEDRYAKGKVINSILRNVATRLGYEEKAQLENLCERTAWRFDQKAGQRSASYNIFKKAIGNPMVFDGCGLTDEEKKVLIEEVVKRMTPKPLKIRADIEVCCFEYEGVEAVKTALTEGKKCSAGKNPIRINLVAAPLFSVTTTNKSREDGIQAIEEALKTIKASIESFSGTLNVVSPPEVVSDPDDWEMRRRAEMPDADEGSEGLLDEEEDGEQNAGVIQAQDDGSDQEQDEEGSDGKQGATEKIDILTIQEFHEQKKAVEMAEKQQSK